MVLYHVSSGKPSNNLSFELQPECFLTEMRPSLQSSIFFQEKVVVERDLASRLQRIKEIESGMPQKAWT